VIVAASILWLTFGYLRTGGLVKELIFTPNFYDLKSSECFLDQVCSYDHKQRVVNYARENKYIIALVESSPEKDEMGSVGQYLIDTYRIENFLVGDKKYTLYLRYYNDRLNQISLCRAAGDKNLLADLNDSLGWDLTEYKKIKKGNVAVEFLKLNGSEDCVAMEDVRLQAEYRVWSQLVY
jgi:hypothetical protein